VSHRGGGDASRRVRKADTHFVLPLPPFDGAADGGGTCVSCVCSSVMRDPKALSGQGKWSSWEGRAEVPVKGGGAGHALGEGMYVS
jgi:hypothetical protein